MTGEVANSKLLHDVIVTTNNVAIVMSEQKPGSYNRCNGTFQETLIVGDSQSQFQENKWY